MAQRLLTLVQQMTVHMLLLATERKVHAFDLSETRRISIGRHDSNQLQLSSRTVSNFHAEILQQEDGTLVLRDLGSTNGTFLNDVRVDSSELESGDQIRIGNHRVMMQRKPLEEEGDGFIRYQKAADRLSPGARGRIISAGGRTADLTRTLQAENPNDLSLIDLLRLLCYRDESSQTLVSQGADVARVVVRKQHIVHAELGNIVGEKALYRVFAWRSAAYEIVEPPDVPTRTIALPVDTLIMEGIEHVLELGRLIATLPPMEASLRLKEDCPLPMTAHSPAEIEIFQLIIKYETVGRVLERSTLTDVRALRLIDSLLRKQVFEVVKDFESGLQETLWGVPRKKTS